MQEQINQLKSQVESLQSQVNFLSNKIQQINYPLDKTSSTIIFDSISDETKAQILSLVTYGTLVPGAPVADGYIPLTINGTVYNLLKVT